MGLSMNKGVVIVLAWLLAMPVAMAAPAAPAPDMRALLDASDWFALRAAARDTDPPLVRGVVASAFNDPAAASLLQQAIDASPAGHDDASDAALFLALQCLREGRTHRAMALLRQQASAHPAREDLQAFVQLVEPFAALPEQAVVARGHAVLQARHSPVGLQVPVRINGHAMQMVLDTGMPWSGISESQARALGMHISGGQGQLGDAAGKQDHVRVAQAEHLSIGALELEHVAFLVFRDDQLPFAKLAPGEQGIFGLPVMLAMRNVRWDAAGRFELGRPASARAPAAAANMAFDPPMTHLLVRGTFQSQPVDFELDTGSMDSNLWLPFATQFPALVQAARAHGRKQSNGLNGSTQVRFAQLDEAVFAVGGATLAYRPARVELDPTKDESTLRDGAIGMDTLAQVASVALDFDAMTLVLGAPVQPQAAASNAGTPAINASK